MNWNYIFSVMALVLFPAPTVFAGLELDNLYTDNMVFQRDTPMILHGTATPNAKIGISFGTDKSTTVTANSDGKWRGVLPALSAGGPYNVQVSSDDTTVNLNNVMVGDVWLCGGQSNMDTDYTFYLDQHPKFVTTDTLTYSNPNVRMFRVAQKGSSTKLPNPPTFTDRFGPKWQECSPNANRNFSMLGGFFGDRLQQATDVPIGLIHSAVGGSRLRTWVPREVMQNNKALRLYLDDDYETSYAAVRVSQCYNAMIAPLEDFPIKGVVWYQGESDAFSGEYYLKNYEDLFVKMVQKWRANRKQPDMPFISVALAGYFKADQRQDKPVFTMIRDAQINSLKSLPKTALVSAIDLGMEDDIHPPFKQVLADRMTSAVLYTAYGKKDAPVAGPQIISVKPAKTAGTINVKFSTVGTGLKTIDPKLFGQPLPADKLVGFEACARDGKYVPVDAAITAPDTVTLTLPKDMPHAKSVQYGWANFPLCNLYNTAELPALPFRMNVR